MAMIAPRIREMALANNYVSAAEMVADRVGPRTHKVVTALILIVAILMCGGQFHVMGEILATIFDVQSHYTIFGIVLVVGFYLWAGGYSTVIRTDIIQLFIVCALASTVFFIPPQTQDLTNFASFASMGNDFFPILLSGFFNMLAAADIYQRIFSTRSDRVARIGLPLGGGFLFILCAGLIFMGMGARPLLPDADPFKLFYEFFTIEAISPYVLAFAIIAIFAMGMSTLDTQVYLFNSTLLTDVIKRDPVTERAEYIRDSRIIMLALMIIVATISVTMENLIQYLLNLVAIFNIAAPAYMLSIFSKELSERRDRLVAASLAMTLLLYGYMVWQNMFQGSFWALIVPPVVASILVALSLIADNLLKKCANRD